MRMRTALAILGILASVPGVALGASTDYISGLPTGLGDTACPDSAVISNSCIVTPGLAGTIAGLTNVPRIGQGLADFPNYKTVPSVLYERQKGAEDFFSPVTGTGREIRACSCDNGSHMATRSLIYFCRKAAMDTLDLPSAGKPFGQYRAWIDADPFTPGDGDDVECAGGGAGGAGQLCCEGITEAGGFTLIISNVDFNGGGTHFNTCGFRIAKGPGAILFDVVDDAPCSVSGTMAVSNAGNVVAADFLPETIIQVDPVNTVENNPPTGPQRYDGTITITAVPISGSPVTQTVTTELTPGGIDKSFDQIQSDIAAALNGMGLGLNATVGPADVNSPVHYHAMKRNLGQSDAHLHFRLGSAVRLRNAGQKLLRLDISGPAGQFVAQSTFDESQVIPTLGEWGMFALTLLLLASGYWLLRRRRAQVGT